MSHQLDQIFLGMLAITDLVHINVVIHRNRYWLWTWIVTLAKLSVCLAHIVIPLSLAQHSSSHTIIKGVAIDPTCINIGRLERTGPNLIHLNGRWLERTEPNLIHFKWGSRVNRHSQKYFFPELMCDDKKCSTLWNKVSGVDQNENILY